MRFKLLLLLVLSVSLDAATVLRMSCGGTGGTDPAGNTWAGDTSFSGGAVWTKTNQPSMGSQPAPYQSLRYSAGAAFSYSLFVPPGNYSLTLKFLEPNKTASGQRIFSVNVNGVTGIQNLDVFAAAGGAMKPYDRTVQVSSPNGNITLNLLPNIGNAILSGIQLDSIDPPPPALAQWLDLAPILASQVPRPTSPNVRLFSDGSNASKISRIDSAGSVFLVEGNPSTPQTICADTSFPVTQYFNQPVQTNGVAFTTIPAGTQVTDVWIFEDQLVTDGSTITAASACVGTSGTPCGYAGAFPLMGVSIPNFRQYPSSGSISITSNADQVLQLQLTVTGGSGNLSAFTGGVVKTRVCTVTPSVAFCDACLNAPKPPPAPGPTLAKLETCTGQTATNNCAGMYRATIKLTDGTTILAVTGVTGIPADSNTWTAVK